MVRPVFENMRIRTLASGNVLNIPVYRFSGGPGKQAYIQANIHGPEIAGIPAAYRLVELLSQEPEIHGSITVVPSVNPVGLDFKMNGMQVGYSDPNEHTVGNFNRIYQLLVASRPASAPTPDAHAVQKVILEDFVEAHRERPAQEIAADFKAELKRTLQDLRAKKGRNGLRYGLHLALTIQELACDADYLIDLHTDSRAVYYSYAFAENKAAFPAFDLPYLILLDPEEFDGVLDEAFMLPWIRLRRAFQAAGRELAWEELGREAFTLELGSGDSFNPTAVEADARRMLNYLRSKGLLSGAAQPGNPGFASCQMAEREHYYAPVGGLVSWHKRPGEQVETGEVVATVLQPAAASPDGALLETPVRASEGGLLLSTADSQVTHQGMQLFSVLTHLVANG